MRTSPLSRSRYQAPPAPAPRLARSLVDDFVKSAAMSPLAATAETHTRVPPVLTKNKDTTAASAVASAAAAAADASAPPPPPPSVAAAAAEAATTRSTTSPLRASDVFGYYDNESEEEGEGEGNSDEESDYVEYEVEEVEEYEEDDCSEEEEEAGQEPQEEQGPPPTLDNVLRRIFRAYSGSPDRHRTELPSERTSNTSPPPAAHDPSLGSSSATRVASVAADAGGTASSSAHPLIQRAAELYRQHRLHQAQQLQRHSPFHTSDEATAAMSGFTQLHRDPEDSSASSVTTSEPSVELNADAESDLSDSTDSSDSYLSPAAAYAALNLGSTASRVASVTAIANAAVANVQTGASPSPPVANSSSSAPPVPPAAATAATTTSFSTTFDQLETAYRQLLFLQRGVEYAAERTGVRHFPSPLPHQEKAQALAQQRSLLVQKDTELRTSPPGGATLEDVRHREAAALEATLASIEAKFAVAMQATKPVLERGASVEEKRRLLNQRALDLAEQREARIIVEREVTKMEDALSERKDQLRKREAEYNAQLQQHDEQQKAAQQQINEVEQLSKQVSLWLGILEERDRRLARKEKRLQWVQADLLRRNEDVMMWKKATQRVKQIPPPPSPPRIVN